MSTRLRPACGAIGAPLFILVFLVEGARRDGYDPMREPVSSLALGPRGWIQRSNFVGTGLLMLAFADGLRQTSLAATAGSRWGPRLIATYGVGLIGAGVFVTAPVADGGAEVPGAAPAGVQGALHVAFSMQVFAALGAAALVYAHGFARRGRPGLARGSMLVGVLVPAGIVVFGRAQGREDRLGRAAGLIQRVTIALGWGWLLVLSEASLSNPLARVTRGSSV